MKYYIIIEGINIVLFILRFDINSFASAAIEFYFLICSNSLYQECLSVASGENAVNTTENTVIKFDNVPSPPPMYNSCENDLQAEKGGMYPQPQHPGMYPQPQHPGMYPQQQHPGMYTQPQHPGMYTQPEHAGMYPQINP